MTVYSIDDEGFRSRSSVENLCFEASVLVKAGWSTFYPPAQGTSLVFNYTVLEKVQSASQVSSTQFQLESQDSTVYSIALNPSKVKILKENEVNRVKQNRLA